jgi:hypothetical protein
MNALQQFNIKGTLPNKVYDVLKWVVLMVLPPLIGLYLALGLIWGYTVLPEVIAVITFISSLIGAVVGISAKNYYEKIPDVAETIGLKIYRDLLWLSMYLLPAVATIYYMTSQVIEIPYPNQVIETIVSFNVFLGLVLGLSSSQNKELFDKMQSYFIKDSDETQ